MEKFFFFFLRDFDCDALRGLFGVGIYCTKYLDITLSSGLTVSSFEVCITEEEERLLQEEGVTDDDIKLLPGVEEGRPLLEVKKEGRLLPRAEEEGRLLPGAEEEGRLLPVAEEEGRLLPGAEEEGRLLPGVEEDSRL